MNDPLSRPPCLVKCRLCFVSHALPRTFKLVRRLASCCILNVFVIRWLVLMETTFNPFPHHAIPLFLGIAFTYHCPRVRDVILVTFIPDTELCWLWRPWRRQANQKADGQWLAIGCRGGWILEELDESWDNEVLRWTGSPARWRFQRKQVPGLCSLVTRWPAITS